MPAGYTVRMIRNTLLVASGLLLLLVHHLACRIEASAVSGPLPASDGQLPRLSALLWTDIGTNTHVGCQTLTLNLIARRGEAADQNVQISLIFLGPTATRADVDRAMGPPWQELLPGIAKDRRLSEELRRWPERTSWWLVRGPRTTGFEMRSLVRPHVMISVQAPWAGAQPAAAALWGTEVAFDVAGRADARELDQLFEHWHGLLKRHGLSPVVATVTTTLSDPGFSLVVAWDGASCGGPRMRSYSSRNAPQIPIGHYTITVEESARSTEARTFVMPYGVTVNAPPTKREDARDRLNQILERVFHRVRR